jgi:hydroxymethylpyrimidine kinase / phosphomethylpyrimidine kinase / thiamine-phosphate diphosphorylase
LRERDHYVLSVAGSDPSGGAGIQADIKTFEALDVHGLTAVTAVTFQTESSFAGSEWVSTENILQQISLLAARYPFDIAKIGLIKDLQALLEIADFLHKARPGIKIIWDPILQASAGFTFHENPDPLMLREICQKIYLMTHNLEEAEALSGCGASLSGEMCNVLIKGGHRSSDATDILHLKDNKRISYPFSRTGTEKHGTGCILSSAIAAYLSKGMTLEAAVLRAKEYITDYLRSSSGLLGRHAPETPRVSKLHYITADRSREEILTGTELACAGGVDWVQLRVKERTSAEWTALARETKHITDRYNARLIINDSPEIAMETGAYGIHLGKNDMSPAEARRLAGNTLIIGGTANSTKDILKLLEQNVDYIGLGPLRYTGTKKNLSPLLGFEGIERIMSELSLNRVSLPIICIGGVMPEDIPALRSLGVYGAAVSSAISSSVTPEQKAFEFLLGLQSIHIPEKNLIREVQI